MKRFFKGKSNEDTIRMDEILQGQTLRRGDQNDPAKEETPSLILPLRWGENSGNPSCVLP